MLEGDEGLIWGGRAQDGDEHGDAERGADLATHGEDRAAGGKALWWQPGHGSVGEGGHGESDFGSADEHAGKEAVGVVRCRGELREPPQRSDGDEHDPGHGYVARPVADREQSRGHGEQGGHERPGGDLQSGGQGVLMPDAGEKQDAAQQHRREPGEEHQRRDVGRRKRPHARQIDLDHGKRMMDASRGEQREQRDRRDEPADGLR